MTLEQFLALLSIVSMIGGGILTCIWAEVRSIRKSVSGEGGLSERVTRVETLLRVQS